MKRCGTARHCWFSLSGSWERLRNTRSRPRTGIEVTDAEIREQRGGRWRDRSDNHGRRHQSNAIRGSRGSRGREAPPAAGRDGRDGTDGTPAAKLREEFKMAVGRQVSYRRQSLRHLLRLGWKRIGLTFALPPKCTADQKKPEITGEFPGNLRFLRIPLRRIWHAARNPPRQFRRR
jgi:hypothetical protein